MNPLKGVAPTAGQRRSRACRHLSLPQRNIIQSLFFVTSKTQNESPNEKQWRFNGYFCGIKERLNSKKNIRTNNYNLSFFPFYKPKKNRRMESRRC
jgi:hypothetical protein